MYNPITDYTVTQNERKQIFFRHEISNSTSTYAHWKTKIHKNYTLKPDHNPHWELKLCFTLWLGICFSITQ